MGGFVRESSSDSYVLLGGGWHKLESSLSVGYAAASASASYASSAGSVAWDNITGKPSIPPIDCGIVKPGAYLDVNCGAGNEGGNAKFLILLGGQGTIEGWGLGYYGDPCVKIFSYHSGGWEFNVQDISHGRPYRFRFNDSRMYFAWYLFNGVNRYGYWSTITG